MQVIYGNVVFKLYPNELNLGSGFLTGYPPLVLVELDSETIRRLKIVSFNSLQIKKYAIYLSIRVIYMKQRTNNSTGSDYCNLGWSQC